jgi:hypothetical protein
MFHQPRRINQALPRVRWQRRTTAPTAKMKYQKSCVGKKDVGPNCGFAASPEVSLGATVGTLQIGYPRVQATCQDEE